jgi:hypothetical protein
LGSSQHSYAKKTRLAIGLIFTIGICARLIVACYGHNFDFISYLDVAKIMDEGGNVYAGTHKYNYGPVWFNVLHFLYWMTSVAEDHVFAFSFAISIVLTIIDVGIYFVLMKKYGLFSAALFFLNPVSIIISGFHRQFDNLAILIGMFAVLMLSDEYDKPLNRKKLLALLLLGLSLATKHVLFAFPLWLAIKNRRWRSKIVIVVLPIAIFLLSFTPYWMEGRDGIIQHVFLYQGAPLLQSAPFWHWFVPNVIRHFTTPHIIFYLMLILSGFLLRKRNVFDLLIYYFALLVIYSPYIANQYLAIVIPFIAIEKNSFSFLYTTVATWYLLADKNGLNLAVLQDSKVTGLITKNAVIVVLTFAFLWPLVKKRLGAFLKDEWRYQSLPFF